MILANTIKGYGLGESGEGKNITHSQKKLNEDELKEFRTRFGIPLSDDEVVKAPFYKLPEDSVEMQYLKKRREELGGPVPERRVDVRPIKTPPEEIFEEFYAGSDGRELSLENYGFCAYSHQIIKRQRNWQADCTYCTRRSPYFRYGIAFPSEWYLLARRTALRTCG